MKNSIFRILLLLMVYSTLHGGLSAQQREAVSIKAKLDSATLLMGNVSLLHLEIVQNADDMGMLLIPQTKLMTDTIELSDGFAPADTVVLTDTRIQIDRALIVQSFDSGLYIIPPFKYVVGVDTFTSNDLVLKVMPVSVDSMTTVNPYIGGLEAEYFFSDMIPDAIYYYWYIYLIILIVIALIAVALWIYWKKPKALMGGKIKVELPPYEQAIANLNLLKDKQLWQSGREKEYYTELTDILRVYLERRFSIYAIEMTSSQIIAAVKKAEDTNVYKDNMKYILEIADFVKFAKVKPMPEENERSFRNAIAFVENTKPVVVEPENSATEQQNGVEANGDGGNKVTND